MIYFCYIGSVDSTRSIVQYWFDGGKEHKVAIKPHGNSKIRKQPYCRTHPSTMAMIKEEAESSSPKDSVRTVYNKQGGIMGATSIGELPRNRQQVSNIRSKISSNSSICSAKGLRDPLFMVMEQSKLCEAGDKFVRVVTACPEPMCLLANDQQLADLARFGTDPSLFSVLSIDPTFSLGDFSVTCITYRHLLVTDPRTGQSPIMLGPLFIHQSKSYSTYHFFASSLIGIAPKLVGVLAFGTDGEEALVKAFKQQFQFAIHLRCSRHMRQDIKRKLTTDMGFPTDIIGEVLADIFGNKEGPTFFEGLVDCDSEHEFDSQLNMLEERWEGFESLRGKIENDEIDFFPWFKKYHAEEIKSTMLRPTRIAAGLGDPPSEFCANDSEAINSSIKQFVQFKKSDWPVFNDKMKTFVLEQQEEVCKTIVGSGQYRLKDEYQSLSFSASDWFTTLNDEQRRNARRKFQEACVVGLQAVVNDKPTEETEEVSTAGLTGCTTDSAGETIANPNQKLSVDIETASAQSGIPTLVLRQIWAKAADLLDNDRVLPAPGCAASARMVASTSKKKPHFVSTTKDGRYECDEDCPNFMQRFICSHCVAAAEDNHSLEAYVKNYGTYAKTPKGQKTIAPNFTRLSMANLTRQTAGRKGNKAPPKKSITQ